MTESVIVSLHNSKTLAALPTSKVQEGLAVLGELNSSYLIRVANKTKKTLKLVLSVDGLNVITRKAASSVDKGFVLDPRQVLDLPGFLAGEKEAEEFVFTASSQGEGTQTLGTMGGIIGFKVFEEDIVESFLPTWLTTDHTSTGYATRSLRYTGNSMKLMGVASSNSVHIGSIPGGDTNTCSTLIVRSSTASSEIPSGMEKAMERPSFLGTKGGEKVAFRTHTIQKEWKGEPCQEGLIFYDTKESWKLKGIDFPAPKISPFPGDI